jgi:shikimate kinase
MTPPGPQPRHIVLIGPMGSGKTTVGRIVAERSDRPLVDSDEQIEASTGMTGRSIAARFGVDRLHRAEAEALRQALARPGPSVIAAAASVGDIGDLSPGLGGDDCLVVLMEGDADVLAERAASGSHRRRVDVERSRLLAESRRRNLRDAVDLVVDVTDIAPEEVAHRILAEVGESG